MSRYHGSTRPRQLEEAIRADPLVVDSVRVHPVPKQGIVNLRDDGGTILPMSTRPIFAKGSVERRGLR